MGGTGFYYSTWMLCYRDTRDLRGAIANDTAVTTFMSTKQNEAIVQLFVHVRQQVSWINV